MHRAAYWYAHGVLELDPEPEPPAPADLAPVVCWQCSGVRKINSAACPACHGTGVAPLVAQAAALMAAARAEACDAGDGPLGENAEMYSELQIARGAHGAQPAGSVRGAFCGHRG